jgi:DNA ligase-1
MVDNFSRLREFVDEMNLSNSSLHKKAVLGKYADDPFIVKVLLYTYHPYKQFHVTAKTLKKWKVASDELEYSNLFELLDALALRKISGHDALSKVKGYLQKNEGYEDLILQIIDRNLETRATETLINHVIPDLIPTFDVALAHPVEKVKGVNLADGTWIVSRKLDGARCIVVIREPGNIQFFSRAGKPFHTLGKLEKDLTDLGISNCVLDGEICMQNEDGSDDFQGILKELQKKDHTIKNPKYWVFDFLTLEEFENKEGAVPLSERLIRRSRLNESEYATIQNLNQSLITEESEIAEITAYSKKSGWEGLIARRNVGYEGKRTRNMLKLKDFYDAEYVVQDLIMAPQRVIVEGLEREEDMLSAALILHKGDPVKVGSGFTIDQRRHYFKNPEELIGMTIKVQFFEESCDQDGKNSLRFPTFKGNYGRVRSI